MKADEVPSSKSENSKNPSRKRTYDKENIKDAKCSRWSLNTGEVDADPPLLEDMGLSILQEDETAGAPTPTPPTTENTASNHPPSPKVLQPSNQNITNNGSFFNDDSMNEEFFVYKRRRLDTIAGDDKFNRMTDEIILAVFRWLPKFMLARCAQVCRRWKRMSFDESLWRRLDLGGKSLKPGVLGRVILRGASVLRLSKAEISSPIFSPQLHYLPSLPPVRSRLQYLDLSMAAIETHALEELLSVCFDLKKLSLEHCTLNKAICSHISNNPKLETLNLAMVYGLSHACLTIILSKCKRLQALNLGWTGLTAEDLRIICRRFPTSLERLNMSGCRSSLSDSHIKLLAEQTPSLVELDVSDGTQLTAGAVNTIISEFRHVEYLAFSRCYTIQPDAYIELKNIPSLLYLDLYGILNESAISTLRQNLPRIHINKYLFSSVARPTVGIRRTSIWSLRVRD